MLKNYIKLAWRVLGRRKFFTFISLFGISFTLGILMVFLSFLQSELGQDPPLSNKEDMVVLDGLRLRAVFKDTVPVIDTVMNAGVEVYDTTFDFVETGSMNSTSDMNNEIAERYLSDFASVEKRTVFSSGNSFDVYLNGVKLTLDVLFCDAPYWAIFDHKILEGRVFDDQDMAQAMPVALISSRTALSYFGQDKDVVDKEIRIDGRNYKVIGMYRHVGKILPAIGPDVVIPYSNMTLSNQNNYYHGFFSVVFQRKEGFSIQQVKDDIREAATKIPLDHPSNTDGFTEVVFFPWTYNEMYAQGIYPDEDASKSLSVMTWVILFLILFFVCLPTLNLINLNVSRIMDRSAEIGVRKAFGAHKGHIIFQFIIENVVQTILGGIIGLGLALLVIYLVNRGGYMGNAQLSVSPMFFLYSFLVTIAFGLLSGLLPARRMAKLQIVNALKENKI